MKASKPTPGLEPTPPLADLLSAPSGRLRSLPRASMHAFPHHPHAPATGAVAVTSLLGSMNESMSFRNKKRPSFS